MNHSIYISITLHPLDFNKYIGLSFEYDAMGNPISLLYQGKEWSPLCVFECSDDSDNPLIIKNDEQLFTTFGAFIDSYNVQLSTNI